MNTFLLVLFALSLGICLFTESRVVSAQECPFPTQVSIRVSKSGTGSGETFKVKNAAGTDVVTYDASKPAQQTVCLPIGLYTVEMEQNAGNIWSDGASANIEALVAGEYITIARGRMNSTPKDTFTFALNWPIANAAANTNMKYMMGSTIPADWTTVSFSDASWTALTDSNRPSTTEKIVLFRNAFSLTSKAGYHGVEMRVKARWGVIVYLNGAEVYRTHVTAGDLSTATTNVGGSTASYWRSIVVPMSKVQEGNNVLAVAIVNAESAITLDFDMTLRLMAAVKNFPRYWDSTATAPSLFDQRRDSRIYVSKTATSQYEVTLTLSNDRAEVFNKYCMVTNWDALRHDPREWKVSGSLDGITFVELDHQQEIYFEERLTSYCFYMLSNTVAYSHYKLTLIKARTDEANNHYALCQWNLYLEDFSQATVPAFAMEPSTLVGYTDAEFPKAAASSPYYHSFTISPALPAGLTLSPMSGAISGVPTTPVAVATYQLSAVDHLGETKTTSITLSVEVCANDKIAFTLEFVFSSADGENCGFELKDLSNDQIVASRAKFVNWNTLSIPMCQHATTYGLILKKNDNSGWGSNYVNVKLVDGSVLLKESLAAGAMQKTYNFNPGYAVAPKWTTWSYHIDGSAAPAGWNALATAPADWATAMTAEMPQAQGVTSYYYTKFTLGALGDYAVMDISVNVRGGAVVYLNGEEVRRINMPEGEITSSTLATNLYSADKLITTSEFVQGARVVEGENILAVEMHRRDAATEVNTFSATAILVMDNMYVIKEGTASSFPDKHDNEGVEKVFDNNSNTKFYYNTQSPQGSWWQWTYNDEKRVVANNYGIVVGGDCNIRHPSGWRVLASNDGENWDVLDEQSGVMYTSAYQQKRFDFFNERAFNQYRVTTTACDNELIPPYQSCGSDHFQLADFYLFSKRVIPDCPRDGDFPPAMNGDLSYAACPDYFEGYRIRMCTDGKLGNETSACTPMKPQGIVFDSTEYNLFKGKPVSITPKVMAAKSRVISFPALPDGLTMDSVSGAITGTPTTVQESKKYTISVTNDNGSASTTIAITIVDPPVNWTLIIIIAVVAVIIIVGIIVAIVMATKSKKKIPAKNPKAAKGSKNMPKAASANKPKATVKV